MIEAGTNLDLKEIYIRAGNQITTYAHVGEAYKISLRTRSVPLERGPKQPVPPVSFQPVRKTACDIKTCSVCVGLAAKQIWNAHFPTSTGRKTSPRLTQRILSRP